MKTLFFLAVVLAAATQAREPENLAALIDEMAVLERVLGAALESETSESARDRSGWRALNDLAGVNLRPWLQESVRTIEAEVRIRTDAAGGYALDLRVVRAAGPGAPEPGSTMKRSAGAVTARGCFRAPWTDEARRERILGAPQQERQTRQQKQDRSQDRGFSM